MQSPRVTMRRQVAACLWMPFEFMFIATVSLLFNAYFVAAIVWHSVKVEWLKTPVAIVAFGATNGLLGVALGISVDFLAYVVFDSVPLFNQAERPTYTLYQRAKHHSSFVLRVICLQMPTQYFIENNLSNHGAYPSTVTSWEDVKPFALDWPLDNFAAFVRFYAMTFFGVQVALVMCDLLYYSSHVVQHKVKKLYDWTNHDYHHAFRFPLSACGPWLSVADLMVSNFTTFLLPANISLALMTSAGLFYHLPGPAVDQQVCFYRGLFFAYIHWLNHHDHSGKQMPLWSGMPLCPPLGFALRLDECIPNHESHHNFHSCGYGLLSIADRIAGTNGFPASHPKFAVTAQSMGKAAAAKLAAQEEGAQKKNS